MGNAHLALCLVVMTWAGATQAFEIESARLSAEGDGPRLDADLVGVAPRPVRIRIAYFPVPGSKPGSEGGSPAKAPDTAGWDRPGSRTGPSVPPAPGPGSWLGGPSPSGGAPPWTSPGASRSPGRPAPPGPEGSTPAPDRSPLALALPGYLDARISVGFDSRMVEQRELPPRRSLPLVLEARTLGSRIHMEYDSGLEGFGPGPVEDDFSSPMVAAWDARDASRLALCGLGRLALQLRARREPLFESRIPRLRGLGAEFPGGATRSLAPAAVSGLYHLPSEPRPFGLEIDAAATVRIAWLDRCDARDDQPLSGFVARLATRTGEVLQEPVRVAVPGPTRIQVAPVRAKRFTLVLHREESRPWEGPLVSVDLAWRWGRPEESWMDQGRPGMPPARLRDEGPARIRAQLEALQFAWNPDDEVFVDPEGGQGLGSRARIMDVLWGAVQILGGGVPDRPVGAPEGSQTALALALAEAQVAATIQDPPQVVDPFRSREMVPSWVPWNALTAALEEAGRALREVHGGRSWTTPIARTLALALHRYLARPEPGQREPLLALVRDFEAARTAGPDPVVERWIGKGTSSFVPAPEDPMGPLWATMVQVAADGLDPGTAGRSPREDPRVEGLADHPRVRGLHALRLRRPRPDDHPPADHRQTAPEPSTAELGDAARIASWLASRHPGPGIVRLAERLVEACWRRYVQDAVTLGFEARLDLLQAFVPLR